MKRYRKTRYSNCFCETDILKTKQNQSLTPSEMDALRLQGLPVASGVLSAEYFNEGTSDCKASDLLFHEKRGIDINDAWNEQKSLDKKFTESYTKFRKKKEELIEKGE